MAWRFGVLRTTVLVTLLLLLLLLVTEDVEGRSRGRKGGRERKGRRGCTKLKSKQCKPTSDKEIASISCKDGSKLFEINILSSRTSSKQCDGTLDCSGQQLDNMLKTMTYIGAQACPGISLRNNTPIIISSQGSCSGRSPHVIAMSGRCTKGLSIEVYNRSQAPPRLRDKQGIVASPHYPWQYPSGLSNYTVTFTNPDGSKRGYFIYTLYSLDLAPKDHLTLRGDTVANYTADNNTRHALHEVKEVINGSLTGNEITMNLVVSLHSTTGHGYLLCYQWNTASVTNVCAELTEEADKIESCDPTARKGKRRRKKGKKNRRKSKNGKGRKRRRKQGRRKRGMKPQGK